MYFGSPRYQTKCLLFSALCALSSLTAHATGYYNFGMQWKGALNSYRLGADTVFASGFTSGLGAPPVSGSVDGMITTPYFVTTDSSGNVYVADYGSNRLLKYNSSGVFQGWMGKISTSPTGGDAGCKGAAVGTATPGWCTGGKGTSGNGDGMLNSPSGLAFDSSGNLYVNDFFNYRIVKYNSSGVFQGWIGKIATSPTGGAAGCNGAAVGTFTPGWCIGGTAGSGTGDGMMNFPTAIKLDSSGNIYVSDYGNHRINKYDSNGSFLGWTGKIATSPTGGAAGCNGAAVGTATPGWCLGGTSASGNGDGMMNGPYDLALDSSGNIYIPDANNSRALKFDSAGVFQGWIGKIGTSPTGGAAGCNGATVGTFTPGWCIGGTAASGNGDGMLSSPNGIAVDSSGNVYVADQNHRVSKYNSSAAFQGWIGRIGTSPTGGAAGCNGATVGTFTPGWCTGGTAASGTGDGMMSFPKHLDVDSSGNIYVSDSNNFRVNKYTSSGALVGALQSISQSFAWHRSTYSSTSGFGDGMLNGPRSLTQDASGNFYVADYSNNRINKFNSVGTFQGWIGNISTSPTGGAAGCSGSGTLTFTPGWCKGGTAASGAGDGMMNGPYDVAVDSSGNFYVADANNYRVNKYDSTGAFQGWIGKIATSPTGGAAGCNGAAVGSATPGWCKGGTAGSGTGDGMLNIAVSLALDSSGNLYVAEFSNNRISKFDSSGVFQGWIGKIATSPTGGDAGCNGAAVGTFTPGWCKGGTSTSGTGDGMFSNPTSVRLDSSGNIYVADSTNHRIQKFNSAGVFQGWIGKIATSPTGGDPGCNGAAVGSATPGWCKGGTSTLGTGDGMLSSPAGVIVDSVGNIYVSESTNHRINKFSAAGVFKGWIGKIATSPTGGATACKGAAASSASPGWCTGGTSGSGSSDGMMNSPSGLWVDKSGNLYVADRLNHRLQRFSLHGR
ncbi:MAG: hypothetical protein ACJ763_04520 [Bdellovibrionia bacterium]